MAVLTPQQASSLRTQLEEAKKFADSYPVGRLVGDTSLEAWKEWFELYTGTKVHVEVTHDTDKVGLNHDGSWTLGLKLDDEESAAHHEKCHVMFSPFDEINKAGSIAADKLADPRIKFMVNVFEDARIEWLGDKYWPTMQIRNNHRAALIRDALGGTSTSVVGFDAEDPQHTRPYGNAKDLSRALLFLVYELPMISLDPVIDDVLDVFKDDIQSTIHNLGGWMGLGDKMASVKLAIRIADYLKWKEPPKDSPTEDEPPPDDEPPTDEPPTEPDDEPSDIQDDSDKPPGEGQGGKPDDCSGDDDESTSSAGSDGEYDADDTLPGITEDELSDMLGEIEKEANRGTSVIKRRVAAKQRLGELSCKSDGIEHPMRYATDMQFESPPLHEKLRSMLDSLPEPISRPRQSTRGRVNPRRVHAIQHGDMKVFTKQPKTRGPVFIMVDCSGSMSCPCEECHAYHVERGKKIRLVEDGSTMLPAKASWQIARAIAKSVGQEAEVYGFDGNWNCRISKPPSDSQPVHASHGGGTPICSALSFIENRVGSDTKGTTVVFITDGQPSPCPGGNRNGVEHTQVIANRLHAAGADFIAIQLGDFIDVFPSSLCIKIPDSYGIRIDDMATISTAIKHIRGK